jgi:hypothetical protein
MIPHFYSDRGLEGYSLKRTSWILCDFKCMDITLKIWQVSEFIYQDLLPGSQNFDNHLNTQEGDWKSLLWKYDESKKNGPSMLTSGLV